jgi:hypothetical protein
MRTCICWIRRPWLYVVIEGVGYEVEPAVADSSIGALFRAWWAGCGAKYTYPSPLVTVPKVC